MIIVKNRTNTTKITGVDSSLPFPLKPKSTLAPGQSFGAMDKIPISNAILKLLRKTVSIKSTATNRIAFCTHA